MKPWLLALLVLALGYSAASADQRDPDELASVAGDPAVVGEWAGPYGWPLVAIHAAVMPTGNILHFSYNANSYVFHPVSGTFSSRSIPANLFCGGQSFLPDGRVIVTGGTVTNLPPGVFQGLLDTHIFDPTTENWTQVEDMAQGRWYPTHLTGPDGRTYVFSGLDENGVTTPNIEVYEPGVGWQSIGSIQGFPLYPYLHLLSNGEVFYAGPTQVTAHLTLSPVGVHTLRNSNYGYRGGGVNVNLPPGPDRVMILGGTRDTVPTATAEIIDLGSPSPAWQYTAPMHFPREHANAVILPDATVLVVGGHGEHRHEGEPAESTAVFEAELYQPRTATWSVMAAMQIPRVYHSTAALLPDGRVLCGGSDGYYFAEFFSPPYLFKGPRPQIDSAPKKVPYGANLCLDFTSTTSLNKVVLVRPTAQTHGVNTESRYVELAALECGPGAKEVKSPANANLAPPGYYMLFVVNEDGVPSQAEWLQLVLDCGDGCDADIGDVCPGATNTLLTGDTNHDGVITSGDIVFSVNHVFKSGPAPVPCTAVGDVDCSGAFTSADVIKQVNYIFKSGAPYCDVCPLVPSVWTCGS